MKTYQYAHRYVKIIHYVFPTVKEGKLYFMAVKLFLLGLPGSGKSTIARYIHMHVKEWDWSISHFSDYPFLQEMFRNDIEGKYFKPADHDGFDAIDLIVLDRALKELEQSVDEYTPTMGLKEIVLIEFARNDYHRAFRQFNNSFLRDAYLLFLEAEIDICEQRILDRVANPHTGDDYFVSNDIFNSYYRDNKPILWSDLIAEFGFDRQKVKVINNNGSLQDATPQINDLVESINRGS
jgi:adenylate kinase family enzyme